MEVLLALQVASKVILREIFLLNFGTYQDMNVTKIAGLYSIRKSMVSILMNSRTRAQKFNKMVLFIKYDSVRNACFILFANFDYSF